MLSSPKTGLWHAYRLRWKRRRILFRIWRKRKELAVSVDRTGLISGDDILGFATVRNEIVRLPHFLAYYRKLGINHFLFVDNGSDDGTAAFLADQPDVSLWSTTHSYRRSRFGMDWLGWLQLRYGNKHWCLTVDADELLVYPECENRDLRDLTAWLDQRGHASFGALMLDLYPKGPLAAAAYVPGDDPTKTLEWFDADNYRNQVHHYYSNLWIQGGVRERVFFADEPARAPTLNKTPLVRWSWRYAYVSSTHQILPTRLHDVFDFDGDSKVSGALLHTKFLPIIGAKSQEELERGQHFQNTALYNGYHRRLTESPDLWHEASCRYEGPAQLVELGLMSKGNGSDMFWGRNTKRSRRS
ncbi:glycosyltransferase family 2 protein [Yoonia sp.]|uniref:glycosyltransferase family 2 protein n=1 Tax=Yoonia sp. TaxID=2212373 RepID=UPI0039750E15